MNFVVSKLGVMLISLMIPLAIICLACFIFYKFYKIQKERNLLLKEILTKIK